MSLPLACAPRTVFHIGPLVFGKEFAMRGIEAAFWGTLGKDPELRTSKTGNPFATLSVAVTVGQADDGKDVSQ
jgi:hypothetical protein